MAETTLNVIGRIFPVLLLVFGVDSVYNGIRIRRMIARDGGGELSRSFGLRQTTIMLVGGVFCIVGAIWMSAKWLLRL